MDKPAHSPASLSVSIVLFRTPAELLQLTLDSLAAAARDAAEVGLLRNVEVFLVDNTPPAERTDAVVKAVANWSQGNFFPLHYQPSPQNLGFGAGNNTVLSGLESDYHLVLNPDVELAANALVEGLARLESDSGVVLVSPRVSAESGQQEFLCKRYPSVLVLLLRGFAPGLIRRPFRGLLDRYEMRDVCGGSKACEVPLASGCFMLLRTAALQRVGGFCESYFLYFEDFDLSLRLAGEGRLLFDPAVRIVHHGGYAASKGLRHVWLFARSGLRFFCDHGWRWI